MDNRRRRANLNDVAERAGVSIATVDRVLNDRGLVRVSTAERVREVARQLGLETGIYKQTVLYNVLLQDPKHLYYRELGREIETAAARMEKVGLRVAIHFLADTSDAAVSREVDRLADAANGLAGVFVQHTHVLEAISRVIGRGKPVVTLLSDLRHPQRYAYVGLDNRTVGRTAGYLIGRLVRAEKGRVVATAETLNYLGLEEREMGLRSILLEKFPHLEISTLIERGGDRDVMIDRVAEAVRSNNVVAVYNAGGRNSVVTEALQKAGRRPGDLVVVGSELTEVSRRYLIDGWIDAVISFPPKQAAEALVSAMLAASGRSQESDQPPAFQPLHVYFAENAVS